MWCVVMVWCGGEVCGMWCGVSCGARWSGVWCDGAVVRWFWWRGGMVCGVRCVDLILQIDHMC